MLFIYWQSREQILWIIRCPRVQYLHKWFSLFQSENKQQQPFEGRKNVESLINIEFFVCVGKWTISQQTLVYSIDVPLSPKINSFEQSIDLAMRDSRKFETSLAIWALAPASPLARESHQTGSRLWYRLGLSSVTIPIIKQMSSFIWIVLSLFTALAEFSWVKKGLLCSIKVLSMIILDGPVSVLKQKSGNQWLTITKKPPVI